MDCLIAREHLVEPESCHHVQTIRLLSDVMNGNYCLMSAGPFVHSITVDPEEPLLLERIERLGWESAARCPYHDHREAEHCSLPRDIPMCTATKKESKFLRRVTAVLSLARSAGDPVGGVFNEENYASFCRAPHICGD